jgi:hypothetical protein
MRKRKIISVEDEMWGNYRRALATYNQKHYLWYLPTRQDETWIMVDMNDRIISVPRTTVPRYAKT